jgi:hypothetical protein
MDILLIAVPKTAFSSDMMEKSIMYTFNIRPFSGQLAYSLKVTVMASVTSCNLLTGVSLKLTLGCGFKNAGSPGRVELEV